MLTVEEAASRMRVSPRTMRKWIVQGKVPAIRYGRSYRINESVISVEPAGGPAAGQDTASRQSIQQRRREQQIARFKQAFRGGTIDKAAMRAEWDEELRLEDKATGRNP